MGTFLRAQSAVDRAGSGAANAVEVPSGTFLRTQCAIGSGWE
jgi:hypothetical protein